MGETRIRVELNDLLWRIGWSFAIGISKCATVAEDHRILKLWTAISQKLTDTISQHSLLFGRRISHFRVGNTGSLPDGTHGYEKSIVRRWRHEFVRVHVIPVATPSGSIYIVYEVIPRINIVLGIGIEKFHCFMVFV
ncbi:hypothetical protein C7408_1414 [Paraburkholderia caballeronis]|nr:hypothetical protein C7408_1414 [Paraburkholderia caballeronis]TDV06877.1 hypothetical protein C7406_14013 [Paraburkholderia caballeronis]